jgi:DNA-binding NarL/FixJ family response regulator
MNNLCPKELSALTAREAEVMSGLAGGLLYKEIANKLGISFSAVHKRQHRIFRKLRVSNRTEAISKWRELAPPLWRNDAQRTSGN